MTLAPPRPAPLADGTRILAFPPSTHIPKCDLCGYQGQAQPTWPRAVRALRDHCSSLGHRREARRALRGTA